MEICSVLRRVGSSDKIDCPSNLVRRGSRNLPISSTNRPIGGCQINSMISCSLAIETESTATGNVAPFLTRLALYSTSANRPKVA